MAIIGGLIGTTNTGVGTSTNTITEVVPATIALDFTTANGISFTLQHNLNTEDFICQLYKTDMSTKELVLPLNISPSGPNHVLIELDVPMDGRIVLFKI